MNDPTSPQSNPSNADELRANSDRPGSEPRVFPSVFEPRTLGAYALLDSGQGWKLERFGEVVMARPDPQALWKRRLPLKEWKTAHLTFERESDRGGRWRVQADAPAYARGKHAAWELELGGGRFTIRPTAFKHVGLFPEQASNWAWTRAQGARLGDAPKLLNLFAYTGVASVLAARAGFRVTHVDASRTSVAWARENARASGLGSDAVRWITEDALTFARREVRRGQGYAGILLDPPHYGRGPKGEKWTLEEGLKELLEACGRLLEPKSFLVLSTYAVGYSPLAFQNLLEEFEGGRTEAGELALVEEERDGFPTRRLPSGYCARWSRGR